MESITQLSLYDLMADDIDVWIKPNKKFGFDMFLETWDGDKINEIGLHPAAAETLADFCQRYLNAYNHATKEVA